jgi:hypothetical protein
MEEEEKGRRNAPATHCKCFECGTEYLAHQGDRKKGAGAMQESALVAIKAIADDR